MLSKLNSRNIRDLAGMVSKDMRMVRSGLLFRSAFLRCLDEDMIEYLNSFKIKTVLDLRSQSEVNSKPDDFLPLGAKYTNVSASVPRDALVLGNLDKNSEKDAEQMAAYRALPFNNIAYKRAFDLLKKGEGPILFHCYAGKDRTGVLAALILILLDVDYYQIFSNYMLSIRNMYLMYGSNDLPVAWMVKEEWLEAALDAILDKYKSYDAYFLEEYGIDQKMKEKIKDNYLL